MRDAGLKEMEPISRFYSFFALLATNLDTMSALGLSSAVRAPGLGALAHRRPRASARRLLRGVIAQSEKPERSNIHPNRDER